MGLLLVFSYEMIRVTFVELHEEVFMLFPTKEPDVPPLSYEEVRAFLCLDFLFAEVAADFLG